MVWNLLCSARLPPVRFLFEFTGCAERHLRQIVEHNLGIYSLFFLFLSFFFFFFFDKRVLYVQVQLISYPVDDFGTSRYNVI